MIWDLFGLRPKIEMSLIKEANRLGYLRGFIDGLDAADLPAEERLELLKKNHASI